MGFFGMLFWFAVLWFAFSAFRRWNSCGSRQFSGDRQIGGREPINDQQPHIDALESRVAELEERLDFTERLVAERREVAS